MAVAGNHRLPIDDFARTGEAGIFTEDDRMELIDGDIRNTRPIGRTWAEGEHGAVGPCIGDAMQPRRPAGIRPIRPAVLNPTAVDGGLRLRIQP